VVASWGMERVSALEGAFVVRVSHDQHHSLGTPPEIDCQVAVRNGQVHGTLRLTRCHSCHVPQGLSYSKLDPNPVSDPTHHPNSYLIPLIQTPP
jgi:hypothetical protein